MTKKKNLPQDNIGFIFLAIIIVGILIYSNIKKTVIVSLNSAQTQAQDTERANKARSFDTVLTQFYLDNSRSYPITSPLDVVIGTETTCDPGLTEMVKLYFNAGTIGSCADSNNFEHRYSVTNNGAYYTAAWRLANPQPTWLNNGNGVYLTNIDGSFQNPVGNGANFRAGDFPPSTPIFVTYGPK